MTCRQKDRFLRLANQLWHTLSLSIWNVGIKALAPMIILINWPKSSWTEKEERSQEANENLSYLNYFEVFRTCLLENTFLNWTHVCNYATRAPSVDQISHRFSQSFISETLGRWPPAHLLLCQKYWSNWERNTLCLCFCLFSLLKTIEMLFVFHLYCEFPLTKFTDNYGNMLVSLCAGFRLLYRHSPSFS